MGGMRPGQAKAPWVGPNGGGGPPSPGDHKVMVTGADTTPDYLQSKIINGFGILPPVVLTPGGDETLQIAIDYQTLLTAIESDIDDVDEMAAVSSNDQTTGFLAAKFVAGANVTLSILNPGASEKLEIAVAVPPDTNDKVKVSALDTTTDYLGAKLAAGANIVLTTLLPAGNEQKEIALSDTPTLTAAGVFGFGDPTVDGSWRMKLSSGSFVIEKRELGVWVQKGAFA